MVYSQLNDNLFSTASYLVDSNFIALVGGLTGFMILIGILQKYWGFW